MKLKQLINKATYGTIGYIGSQDDLDLLEQYIVYNLPVLEQFQHVAVATNYSSLDLIQPNAQLWKKYFPECTLLDSKVNRGHCFGTADLDDMLFDYCKENKIEWLCKSANDILVQETILDKEVDEANFYYLNGIGYGGMDQYDYIFDRIIKEDFYPQTNFYFINIGKTDYLNDKNHITEIYDKVQDISNYSGKAWEYGFRSCEHLLGECIRRNQLSTHHLLSNEKYRILLQVVKDYNIHDCSHKNIMVDGICHFQFNDQQVINIQ